MLKSVSRNVIQTTVATTISYSNPADLRERLAGLVGS